MTMTRMAPVEASTATLARVHGEVDQARCELALLRLAAAYEEAAADVISRRPP